ncbi:hypothetical protein TNCV_2357421 [Trichonephila clavipes]|nr:hypothetical protein TNCV_2357421 [Trichonephila clavipes]
MLNSSLTSIENLRYNFANIKEEAIGLAKKLGITPEFEEKRHRKVRQFFDDINAALLPKRLPVRFFLKDGNRKNSLGERSGLNGGWCRRFQPRVAIWFCIAVTECDLALSSNNRTPDLRSSDPFFSESICLITVDLYPMMYPSLERSPAVSSFAHSR